MNPYIAEALGTFILILIGDGVCANVSLKGTKGNSAGWLAIATGWGMAVFVAVLCTAEHSGAHINPAVSIGLAIVGDGFSWGEAIGYIVAQMIGAIIGAVFVYLMYVQHFQITDDANAKLGSFCTAPQIYETGPNLLGEAAGTFVLVFAVLASIDATLTHPTTDELTHKIGLGAIGALPVAFVVFAIGLGLGGTTGYGINPARDLGPRIAHFLLPIPDKRDSDWGYAWIPVIGPILGSIVAAVLYLIVA